MGTGTNTNSFRGAPEPRRDIFLSRVDSETTDNDIENYIKEKGCRLTTLTLKSHPESKFKSYQITVPVSEYGVVMSAEFWPVGVAVRPFRRPRAVENEN